MTDCIVWEKLPVMQYLEAWALHFAIGRKFDAEAIPYN